MDFLSQAPSRSLPFPSCKLPHLLHVAPSSSCHRRSCDLAGASLSQCCLGLLLDALEEAGISSAEKPRITSCNEKPNRNMHTLTLQAFMHPWLKKKKKSWKRSWGYFKTVKSKLTFPIPWEIFITWVPVINQQADAQSLLFKLREKLDTLHAASASVLTRIKGGGQGGTQHFIYQQISGVVATSRREEPKPSVPQFSYLQSRQTRLWNPGLLPQPAWKSCPCHGLHREAREIGQAD